MGKKISYKFKASMRATNWSLQLLFLFLLDSLCCISRNYLATEETKPFKSHSKVIETTLSCQYYIVCIETVFLKFKSCYCSRMFYSLGLYNASFQKWKSNFQIKMINWFETLKGITSFCEVILIDLTIQWTF